MLEQALVAKRAWLEVASESGKPIPAPRYRPVMPLQSKAAPHSAVHSPTIWQHTTY